MKKRDGDAGYDLYARTEKDIKIKKHKSVLIPTNQRVAINSTDMVGFVKERGSTGVLGMKVSSGVIDSNFRGEIQVVLYNGTHKTIVITDKVEKAKETMFRIYYPKSKAIAQMVLLSMPSVTVAEVSDVEFEKFENTERGTNMLGSTN